MKKKTKLKVSPIQKGTKIHKQWAKYGECPYKKTCNETKPNQNVS